MMTMMKKALVCAFLAALVVFTGCTKKKTESGGAAGGAGKKKALVFALLALVVFTGCTKKTESGGADNAAAPAEQVKSIVLTVWESTNGPDEFIKQAGEAYTKLHPNVTIKFVNVELGDSHTQIALDGPAGVGPDLFAAPHDTLGELVTNGHILPTANSGAIASQILGACLTATTYGGIQYGYPLSAETYALMYNKSLISENEVPKTWDDMIAFAKNFNQSGGGGGNRPFVMDVGNAYYTILFTTLGGNRLFGASGTDTTNTNLNTPAAVSGMQFFQSLRPILNVPAGDLNTSVCDGAFAAGNAAIHISGPWNVKPFTEAGIDLGIAPVPSLPGESTPAATFSGTRVMFVSAYSNHPEEANDFGAFLVTPEMQQLRAKITNTLPSIDTPTGNPYAQGFVDQLNYAFPMPSIPPMAKFWDAMNAASANIWNGADVKQELDACNAAIVSQ
ncbi:MAG: maltose ABC transporter substrate-binding protein [Treponema sp.]|jgi:arabinogalactan oligomer/maltooligosaccharide transport system substrate-binding protein|nr:maltose ABC transporter substrate-binding protein [Treponema sp.]